LVRVFCIFLINFTLDFVRFSVDTPSLHGVLKIKLTHQAKPPHTAIYVVLGVDADFF